MDELNQLYPCIQFSDLRRMQNMQKCFLLTIKMPNILLIVLGMNWIPVKVKYF